MGSVKNLKVLKPAKDNQSGIGRFLFSDRYSVFDWGEMPDHIPHKGEALCLLTAYFFEKLEDKEIKTHYRGLIENGEVKKLKELDNPSNNLEVDLVRVIEPEFKNNKYDYSVYNKNISNCLIPLEIIYRNTLPEHSSFRRRAQKGEINISDYGLEKMPAPGTALKKPILDASTKLEASDRYISWQEAKTIASLSDDEIKQALDLLMKVDNLITKEVEKAGLKNLDGKIELAFDGDRNLIIVDAVGTPDECRFSYNGFSISKEAIRKYYRSSEWYQEVKNTKKDGNPDWKETVNSKPEPLPAEILNLVSQLYMTCANEITGRKWFDNTASFAEIKRRLTELNSK